MSVMGSQLEIDMDPDGDLTVVPRHQGQTGTGCYRLHDHRLHDIRGRKGVTYTAPGATAGIIDPDEGLLQIITNYISKPLKQQTIQ